jgi:hypothetical protein
MRENGTRTRENSTTLRQCMSSVHALIAVKLHGTIIHVTLDVISAVFALESICWTMRVEIAKVSIISGDFWRFGGVQVCIYGYTPLFLTGIFAP